MSKAGDTRIRARRKRLSGFVTSGHDGSRGGWDSVRSGLILVILIAITPLATASIVQGVLQLRRTAEDAQHQLMQRAMIIAASQESIFASSGNVLQALRNVPEVVSAGPQCQAILYGATLSLPFAANIAVIDPDGNGLCSALPAPSSDVSQASWWRESARRTQFHLTSRMVSRVTNTDIVAAVLPLISPSGAFQGALVLAVDGSWLDQVLSREAPVDRGVAMVIDGEGRELVSNMASRGVRLAGSRILATTPGERANVVDDSGQRWSYAVAPIEDRGLLVAYARPSDALFPGMMLHVVLSFVLPVAMVVFTIIAMWLATDRMVLRWLVYLCRVAAVYAQGHYGFRPARMAQAPRDFRVLGEAIENMARAIRERDARLREGLAEKTALVRETHHRIKNSLQIVVSLISLYGSGVAGEKDRRRFDQLRMRVNTLAVVHRVLYEANDGSHVHVGELLRELSALLEGALDRRVLIEVEAEELSLSTDLAVPLALLLAELAMAVAARESTGSERLLLSCRREADSMVIVLTIGGPLGDLLNEVQSPLAHGFARQLGARMEAHDELGHGLIILRLAVR